MKKIFGILICLILLVCAIVAPTVAFASESASGNVTIHFLNPTAIAAVGNSLFVVDNVDTDAHKSVILTFSIEDTQAIYHDRVEIDGSVTNIASKGNDGLYVILSNKVIEYSIGENATLSKVTEFGESGELIGFIDATYGQSGVNKTEYFLSQNGLYRNDADGWPEKFSGGVSNIAIDNYVYYLYNSGNTTVTKRYNGSTGVFTTGDVYNNGNGIAALYQNQPIGLFEWDGKPGVYWKDKIHYVEITTDCSLPLLLDYKAFTASEETINIKDVSSSNGKFFVLNDKNIIEVFAQGATKIERLYTVGSDMVDQDVPHDFNSFTLARPTGYPGNLIFKTNEADTSIVELVTDVQEYIILGYEGDEDSLYYYVLTNDNRFGWVQKTNPSIVDGKIKDDKLVIVNTDVSRDSKIEYTTKFKSQNAVYLYNLPRSNESFKQDKPFQQTSLSKPEVTVKQYFTEPTADGGLLVWYYVSFEDDGQTKFGFIQSQYVDEFSTKIDETVTVMGDKKINSTLFEAVKMYMLPDKELMTDELVAARLYSGMRVTLISIEDGIAYIQVQRNDGTNICGYVDSSRLIGLHEITTNAIVGLSLLGVAIVIAAVFLTVYFHRKKEGTARAKKN